MTHQDHPLNGKRVLALVEDLYEDLELWYPVIRLREAGAEVVLACPDQPREFKSKHGYPAQADIAVGVVNVDDFDGVIIPGGYAPDRLRRHEQVTHLVRQFAQAGKLVGFICHAAWVPISAGVLNGVSCTCFAGIKDDVINAGGKYEDRPVVIDRNFVSSRTPADLPDFSRGLIAVLAAGINQEPTLTYTPGQFARTR